MRLAGTLANFALKASDSIQGRLRTLQARNAAEIGPSTRFAASGQVVNIPGRRERIVVGGNCVICGQLLIFAHAGQIRIGDWVFIGKGSHVWSSSELSIGNRVLISHNVEIHDTESHPLDPQARAEQMRSIILTEHPQDIEGIKASPISIGDDVWIGFGATIKRGVTIGDRAIIGARAIVDRDVPAGGMVKAPASGLV